MATREGEQGQQGGDRKRRKIATMEIKAMVFIEDFHAHAISDGAHVKWHREVQTARNKCQDEMMRAGVELALSCKDTGMQTPVDIADWFQRRVDDKPQ